MKNVAMNMKIYACAVLFCVVVPAWGMYEAILNQLSEEKKAGLVMASFSYDLLEVYEGYFEQMLHLNMDLGLLRAGIESGKNIVKIKKEREQLEEANKQALARLEQEAKDKQTRLKAIHAAELEWLKFLFFELDIEKKLNDKWGPTQTSLGKIQNFKEKLSDVKSGITEKKIKEDVVKQVTFLKEVREEEEEEKKQREQTPEDPTTLSQTEKIKRRVAASKVTLEQYKDTEKLDESSFSLVNDALQFLRVKDKAIYQNYYRLFEDRFKKYWEK